MSRISSLLGVGLLGAAFLLPSHASAQADEARAAAASTPTPPNQMFQRGASPSGVAAALADRNMPNHASAGQRASRIVGSNIHNDTGATIGAVDDLIIGSEGSPITAILWLGGFFGIGGRLVAVPLADLRYDQQSNRWTLPRATRDILIERPDFAYDPRG